MMQASSFTRSSKGAMWVLNSLSTDFMLSLLRSMSVSNMLTILQVSTMLTME